MVAAAVGVLLSAGSATVELCVLPLRGLSHSEVQGDG